MEILRHEHVIFAYTALVTDRPHQNTGAVFVSLHHALRAIEICGCPFVAVGQGVPRAHHAKAMRFDVCLVANVKTEAVAKLKEARVVGIMARSDHIDVVRLENGKVAQHMLHRGGATKLWVAIVAVNALALDLFAVDKQHLANHLKATQTNLLTDDLAATLQIERIEIGRLVAPKRGGFDLKRQRKRSVGCLFARCDLCTCGRNKAVRNVRFATKCEFCCDGGTRKIVI